MVRFLFDGTAMQSTSTAKFHGGSEYAKFIFRELIKRDYYFDVVVSKYRDTDEDIIEILEKSLKGSIIEICSNEEIYKLANIDTYDVFFSAHPYEYGNYSGSTKLIGVIHGIRTIELPWDRYKYKFYQGSLKRQLAKVLGRCNWFIDYWRNKHIKKMKQLLSVRNAEFITVSNHSKYALLTFFPFLKEEQITVFYSPFSLLTGKSIKSKPYFLIVSGNRYEKNVWRAAMAFDRLFTEGRLQDYRVVITGSGDKRIWHQLKNIDRFDLKGYVSYEELGTLYSNAFSFIYPSLNEGFGYPPLYAMALGVPVIASSSTSIPEVCGNAACYFSPTSVDDLCGRILRVVYDDEYRNNLITAGRERVRYLLEQQNQSVEKMINYLFNHNENSICQ